LLGRLALANRDASRWVRGGGATGPRLRPSASRRFGVGRPFPAVRAGSVGDWAGAAAGAESVLAELSERRRNLTSAA
jgi:hypothetical protein